MSKIFKKSNNKGFTLVELLVVITIISVLSLVGITLYSTTLKNARDAKRRADIDSIAKAMEVNKVGNTYTKIANAYFSSSGVPVDDTANKYCIKGNSTDSTTPGDPTSWISDQACPTGGAGTGSYASIVVDATSGEMVFTTPYKAWKICARLESSTGDTTATGLKVYCRASTL